MGVTLQVEMGCLLCWAWGHLASVARHTEVAAARLGLWTFERFGKSLQHQPSKCLMLRSHQRGVGQEGELVGVESQGITREG